MRKTKPIVATSIDNVTEDVPNHFRDIYKTLYNSVEDTENMARVSNKVEEAVSSHSMRDVNLVT